MSVFQTLAEKPWSAQEFNSITKNGNAYRTGLKVLIAVICMLFFLFVIAFLMRSQYPDWQPLSTEPSHPLYNLDSLWLNTLFLLLASVFLQIVRLAPDSKWHKVFLLVGGSFSVAFVMGQWLFWQQLTQDGFGVKINPAMSFFYLLTGLHAAHVLGGLFLWFASIVASLKDAAKKHDLIRMTSTYWHFLLLLWLFLFALLTSTPETYNAIAAFCGLGSAV